jgi:hypothetical protein
MFGQKFEKMPSPQLDLGDNDKTVVAYVNLIYEVSETPSPREP